MFVSPMEEVEGGYSFRGSPCCGRVVRGEEARLFAKMPLGETLFLGEEHT